MAKKIIKRTEGGKTLYFGTHSDAVQVGEGNNKGSLTDWMAEVLLNHYLKSETYSKGEVDALVAAIKQFVPVVAQTLPTASADTMYILYFVPSTNPKTQNVKDEFITIDNGAGASPRYTWEQVGSTELDLSGYYTSTQVDNLLDDKADKMFVATYNTTTLAQIIAAYNDGRLVVLNNGGELWKLGAIGNNSAAFFSPDCLSYYMVNANGWAGPTETDVCRKSEVPVDVSRTQSDATFVNGDNEALFYMRQASTSLAGLMTAQDKTKLDGIPSIDNEPTNGSNNLVKSGGVADLIFGNVYVDVTKNITVSDIEGLSPSNNTINIFNDTVSIPSGETISVSISDPSGVTKGTVHYKLNGGKSLSLDLNAKLMLEEAVSSLRIYLIYNSSTGGDFSGEAGELHLIVKHYAINDVLEEYTNDIAQNTTDIAANTINIATNTQNIAKAKQDIALIMGEPMVIEETLDTDSSTVFFKNVLEAGKSYTIKLVDYDATNVASNKIAFAVYADNHAVRSVVGGDDLSGNTYSVNISSGVTATNLIGRANGNVSIEIYLKNEIDNINAEITEHKAAINNINEILEGEDGHRINLFVTNDLSFRANNNDWSYVFEVNEGDILFVKAKDKDGLYTYNNFTLCKDSPVIGGHANLMDGESNRRQFSKQGTTVTIANNGYVVVTDGCKTEQDIVDSITINGEDVINLTKGLIERVKDLEDSGSVVGVDEELSTTSVNPVQNKVLTPIVRNNKMMTDHDMFVNETDWKFKEDYLESIYASREETALTPFMTKFRARAGSGVYQIGVISDTHGSGAYSWQNIQKTYTFLCHRSIAVFNKIMTYCDAAIHGGDISCDYGTSRLRDLQYMYEVIRNFSFNKPFFITKGNHDENNNAYIEADMLNLDWQHKTYYQRSFSTFSAVTELTWDGSPLYVKSTELVSDREFRNYIQHWLCPNNATWGNGAYYFYDIDNVKIRVIVANSFPVNDSHVISEDEEYLWLAQTALNFSAKNNPQDWQTIIVRHTQSTSIINLSNCINAFMTGGTWTYGNTTVDFGELNGGTMTFIAHIHGHEHKNCFSNGAGYFDIGENCSSVDVRNLGDATKYGISVWSIDTINKKVYEDTISGYTWVYNYNSGKIEIGIGEKFVCADSGLKDPITLSSSDTSVATCNGSVVTGVSEGNAVITATDGEGNTYQYQITITTNIGAL